jgi:hypothetical protein
MEDHQIRTYFQGESERKIKSGLDGTLGTVRFLGNIADVYLCRLVDTVVGMAKSDGRRQEDPPGSNARLTPEQRPKRDKKYPNL